MSVPGGVFPADSMRQVEKSCCKIVLASVPRSWIEKDKKSTWVKKKFVDLRFSSSAVSRSKHSDRKQFKYQKTLIETVDKGEQWRFAEAVKYCVNVSVSVRRKTRSYARPTSRTPPLLRRQSFSQHHRQLHWGGTKLHCRSCWRSGVTNSYSLILSPACSHSTSKASRERACWIVAGPRNSGQR